MSGKHTMTLDYQIEQARRIKRLEADNSRLRALLVRHNIPVPRERETIQTRIQRSWLAQD